MRLRGGVDEEDHGERLGRVDVDVEPADDAADADPEVDEREVDAEVLLPEVALDHRCDERVEPRPGDAEVHADQHQRDGRDRGVRREREQGAAGDHRGQPGEQDGACAVAVDEGAARAGHDQAGDRDQAHQRAGESEVEAAHLVQVDDRERQGQPAPERLDRDRRQQPAALGGECAPERSDADHFSILSDTADIAHPGFTFTIYASHMLLREGTSRDLQVETDRGVGARHPSPWRADLAGDPLRGLDRRCAALRCTRAGTALGRRARRVDLRAGRPAEPEGPVHRRAPEASPKRGLPQRQRDRARRACTDGGRRDGVHPRRRVQRRLGGGVPAAGRAARAPARHRVRQPELPARRARLAGLPRLRVAAASVRVQPRPARPGRRARVGAPEHPRVRRRPGERHPVRRVVGRELGDDPHDRARRGGPLRAGDRAELARARGLPDPRSPRSGQPST